MNAWTFDLYQPAAGIPAVTIYDEGAQPVAWVQWSEDAERIVRAVNAHAAMRAALLNAPTPSGDAWPDTYVRWFHERCAALALAEGKA